MSLNHTAGIEKAGQRARLMAAYRQATDRTYLSRGQYFFTLGGLCGNGTGRILPDSELAQLVRNRTIELSQYISAETKRVVHEANAAIPGPTWFRGDFLKCLEVLDARSRAAVINADFMCGVHTALDKGWPVRVLEYAGPGCVVHINLLAYNRLGKAYGRTFEADTFKFLLESPQLRPFKKRVKLLSKAEYHSKTVGAGAGASRMASLILQKL